MEKNVDVKYFPEHEFLVFNQWVFEKKFHQDISFICCRSSGASDYAAEWWYNNGKYQLKWKAYHETDVNIREKGTLKKEVDTIYEVLSYCATHLHPDL